MGLFCLRSMKELLLALSIIVISFGFFILPMADCVDSAVRQLPLNLYQLSSEVLAHQIKPKASTSAIRDIFYFLWAQDEYSYEHPRSRIQLAFAFLLLIHHRLQATHHFPKGLYYRDFSLFAIIY